MNKILITTDLGKDKDIVIREGMSLASTMNADVELLTVVNKNIEYMPADIGMDFADQWEARKYWVKKELEAIKDQYAQLKIKVVVFVGDPKLSIIDRAVEKSANIIVIGTHGRTGLMNLLMGSTAEYVVRHSPIPVLVIPLNNYSH